MLRGISKDLGEPALTWADTHIGVVADHDITRGARMIS